MISSEPTDSHRPAWLASFSGAEEKPVSASNAKRIILRSGYLVSPAKRSSRS